MNLPARPHVLLVNDDGIEAPGLAAMAAALTPLADLTIVAPREEQSGMSHALSVFKDLHLEPFRRDGAQWGWSLAGTPVDCVKVALVDMRHARPIDLVVSGINRGQNAGTDILYSGTVAAAREATLLGLPAMAVSLLYRDENDLPFETAARVGVEVFQMIRRRGLPPGILLNVNVPPVAYDALRGWTVTRMGTSFYEDLYVRHDGSTSDTGGQTPSGMRQNIGKSRLPSDSAEDGLDDHALARDMVSITPLQTDLTAHAFLGELERWMAAEHDSK